MPKLRVTRRVLSTMLGIAAAICLAVLGAGTASADQDHKVQICHNGHTIEVDIHAVPAHLAHGDVPLVCGERPPCACSLEFDPVTCADGKTYVNSCIAACAGAPGPCNRLGICSDIFDPVNCGGKIYASQCAAENAGCTGPFIRLCACGLDYNPVRCADGNIYVNACVAQCQGATGCTPINP